MVIFEWDGSKMKPQPGTTAYDRIPYPTRACPQTHPDLLGTLGLLFGMSPAPADRCRVLEIGCGDGSNLIPMAYNLPASQFLGIDLAQGPMEAGWGRIRRLGLSNIILRCADLMDFPGNAGTFDYVIAHGFYSWVPPVVREKLLAVCRAALAPSGIAFISYNVYPGAYVRRMVREMILFHVDRAPDHDTRIRQARSLVRFLADAVAQEPDEYEVVLQHALRQVRDSSTAALYHDDMAEVNDPVYFHEFMGQAGAHGLQYLCEAEFFMTQLGGLTEEARLVLEGLGGDRLLREQYLDFIRCRRFRQTLLCRQEESLRGEPDRDALRHLRIASGAFPAPDEADAGPDTQEIYRNDLGATMICSHPAARAAMRLLMDTWPCSLRFEELADAMRKAVPDAGAEESAALATEFVMRSFGLGIAELRRMEPRLCRVPGKYPAFSPLARVQLETADIVTNQRHVPVNIADKWTRMVTPLLDGTRDRETLASELRGIQGVDADIDSILKELTIRSLLVPSPD